MEHGFKPACPHPLDKATPVPGKICTYECGECGIQYTRTRPNNWDEPTEVPKPGDWRGPDEPQPGGKPPLRKAKGDDKALVVALVNMLVQAMGPWRDHMDSEGAQPNADTVLLTAGATWTGTLLGELVGMGILREADLDKHLNAIRSNAMGGYVAGKAKVHRINQEQAAQLDKGQLQ